MRLGLPHIGIDRSSTGLRPPMAKPVGMWYFPGHWLNPDHGLGPPYSTYGPYWWYDQYGGAYLNRTPLIGPYDERDQSTLDLIKLQCRAGGVDFLWFNYYAVAGVPDGDHAIKNFMTSSVTGVKFAVGFESTTANAPVTELDDWSALCDIWGEMADHADYHQIDGRPVMIILTGEHFNNVVAPAAGRTPAQLISILRTRTEKDWYVVFCATATDHWTYQAKVFVCDAFSAYNLGPRITNPDTGVFGPEPTNYDQLDANYQFEWDRMVARLTSVELDYILPMTAGFDDTPWKGIGNGKVYGVGTPGQLQRQFNAARRRMEASAIIRAGINYAFNEDAEGGWMQPDIERGDQKLRIWCGTFKGVSYIRVPAAPPPVQAPAVATTFDSDYSLSFALAPSTSAKTLPVQAKPAKGAFYVDQRFGTRIRRVTAISESTAVGNTRMRHEYSRRQAYNVGSTRRLAQTTEGFWHLYDTASQAKVEGGNLAAAGVGAVAGMAGDCEPIWHPTDPNKLWHTATNGGTVWYERDIVAGTTTTLFDLTSRVQALPGFSDVTRVWFNGEGRPSDDGRWWGLACETEGFVSRGFIMYDRQTDTIVGSMANASGNRPNWTSTSPLGNFVVLSFYSVKASSLANEESRPLSDARGVRAYTRDFSSFKAMSVIGEHSDLAIDKAGNEVYVSASYSGGYQVGSTVVDAADDGVLDGALYYRRLDNPSLVYNLPLFFYSGSTGPSFHISGCATDRPGWVVGCKYSGVGSGPYDGQLFLAELAPTGARLLALAHHHADVVAVAPEDNYYFAEPHPSPNRDLTRILFSSDWDSTSAPEDCEICLPSWAIPT